MSIIDKLYGRKTAASGVHVEKPYTIGDKYSTYFDYLGMVKMGTKANVSWGIKKLTKLAHSFESVNYHTESHPLFVAIKALEKKQNATAKEKLKEFNKLCLQVLVTLK